jgi:thiamine-monophosphate kinase
MNRFFASGREFSLIEKMFGTDHFRSDARGLGDDAFLFEPHPGSKWVITTDASVEGVHFRLDWTSPERALRKALLANLSDVNAMGGRSRHVFLTLGARRDWGDEVFTNLGRALQDMENEFAFRISGGDTLCASGPCFFALAVMGEVEGRPLLRSACRPGQRIYVSGTLGGSAAGLRILERGKSPETSNKSEHSLIDAHLNPNPPLELGPMLASFDKTTGGIDISDGLSSELWHLSRQSGCSLQIDWEKVPVHPVLAGCNDESLRALVLNGGEEYQLLFTGDFSAEELTRLRALACVTEIGEITHGEGVFLTESGHTNPLSAGGFSH